MAASPRVKMLHFTCTNCRDERQVDTLFCTLVQPTRPRCTCPYFVDLHEACGGPEGEGLLHISRPLDNIVSRDEDLMQQFMIPTYRERTVVEGGHEVQVVEVVGTQWVNVKTEHVYCTKCNTMIGYRFIRTGTDDQKLSIVGDKLMIEDIDAENPNPTYLLNSAKVTKFLTKRK